MLTDIAPVIEVAALHKRYGTTVAVDDVSFAVGPGEVFGLVGTNGAGKTTTLECILGLRQPDAGMVRVLGLDPARQGPEVRMRVGAQLQGAQLPPRLRAREALVWFASFYPRTLDPDALLEQWGLADKRSTAFGDLSGGQRQRLFVALALDPDVVLMDLRMPGGDGVDATARIVAAHPRVRVLVLTTYDTDADVLRAVEAGASGYLLKDTPAADLRRAVRATAEGQTVLAPAVAARLVRQARHAPVEDLSARELEVLELVARGATNRDIGRALHVSEATVKSHLVHAFTKLGVNDRTAAVTTALGRGLIRL